MSHNVTHCSLRESSQGGKDDGFYVQRHEGVQYLGAASQIEASEGMRLARFCRLEEALGLIFSVMTVAYIVLSLFGLKP